MSKRAELPPRRACIVAGLNGGSATDEDVRVPMEKITSVTLKLPDTLHGKSRPADDNEGIHTIGSR